MTNRYRPIRNTTAAKPTSTTNPQEKAFSIAWMLAVNRVGEVSSRTKVYPSNKIRAFSSVAGMPCPAPAAGDCSSNDSMAAGPRCMKMDPVAVKATAAPR